MLMTRNMTDDLDFLYIRDEHTNCPEVLWSDVPVSAQDRYTLVILGANKPQGSHYNPECYVRFKVMITGSIGALKDQGKNVYIEIPKRSLKRAWLNAGIPIMPKDRDTDIMIVFSRPSQRSMVIHDYEFVGRGTKVTREMLEQEDLAEQFMNDKDLEKYYVGDMDDGRV